MTIIENMRSRRKRLVPEPDRPFNVNELVEQNVEDALQDEQPHDLDHESMQQVEIYAPPSVRETQQHHTQVPPLPEFVDNNYVPRSQQGAAPPVAMENISAETVKRQYELAARQIESMGDELKAAALRCEDTLVDISIAVKFVEETAANYRSGGEVIFERLEKVSALVIAVTETCTELRRRFDEGSTNTTTLG